MGKYMRKAKFIGDVAVMEVVSQSSLGVRTRAKTLALRKLQSTLAAPSPPKPESSYLQLRSRRLEKILPLLKDRKKPHNPNPNRVANSGSRMSSGLRLGSMSSASAESISISCSKNKEGAIREITIRVGKEDEMKEDLSNLGTEPSFGENIVDFEGRERSTRESTPCSLTRELDTTGSTTRRTASSATNQRIQNTVQRNMPTAHEIEEFFASAEQQQQRLFAEKYNFDIVNDLALPGRYEWVRVNH